MFLLQGELAMAVYRLVGLGWVGLIVEYRLLDRLL